MEPEAKLIARSKKGDADAFSSLVSRYEDRIFNLAHKVCAGMPAEAEDVYQETFLTAWDTFCSPYCRISLIRFSTALGL